MTDLKAVNTVEGMIKKILTDRETELASAEDRIAQADAAIVKADEALKKASAAGDAGAYRKAKAELRDAKDIKEMYTNRFDVLKGRALISKEEYEKAVADIYGEIEAINDQTKKTLAKLSEQMEAAADELLKATDRANEVLRRLQHDVYRDADRTRSKDGRVLNLLTENKIINSSATILWGKCGVGHHQYKVYTGKEQ